MGRNGNVWGDVSYLGVYVLTKKKDGTRQKTLI